MGCLGWVAVAPVPEHLLITWHNLLWWVSGNRARISVSLPGFTPSLARTSQLQTTNKQGHQLECFLLGSRHSLTQQLPSSELLTLNLFQILSLCSRQVKGSKSAFQTAVSLELFPLVLRCNSLSVHLLLFCLFSCVYW